MSCVLVLEEAVVVLGSLCSVRCILVYSPKIKNYEVCKDGLGDVYRSEGDKESQKSATTRVSTEKKGSQKEKRILRNDDDEQEETHTIQAKPVAYIAFRLLTATLVK